MWRVCTIVVALSLAVTGSVAVAESVHFKKPGPAFTTNLDQTLSAAGALAGLGNGDVKVVLDATGTAHARCQNPGGSSKVPGQNPIAVKVTGVTLLPASAVKNGTAQFSVSTAAPVAPSPIEAGCPNERWSVVGLEVTYTSATITVLQDDSGQDLTFNDPGTMALQKTFAL